ncbi:MULTISPECIES: transglycosylase domain-containing protein [unclassified Granulicatella]|uniref:transglycosylase domain-containing protein n=1 Tax=unclassified Granulicatella TaxID=2630493 RepID=UPI00107378AE|nr:MULTISPECIES: transglycosylase domain-containing protein [unclassified Granulicatella]MBF0780082.1 penicillin-binding protein [Granulicatella sp. 19428wC4_WM01]TFU95808.1 penicillin-binding protein [Granulicatella sp. WM01]
MKNEKLHELLNRMKQHIHTIKQKSLTKQAMSIFNISFGVTKRLFYLTLLCLCFLMSLGLGIGLGYFANIISHTSVPSQTQMQTQLGSLNQASALFFQDGDMISEVQSDLVRKVVPLQEISDYVKQGIIATEDDSFYTHNGIVPKAVLRAILQEISGSDSQTGGSTLTQQLVKQQLLTNELTFTRKAKEILLAMRVEKYFSKDDILNAYLNVSSFGRNNSGQNIAGIQAAAEGVFGKQAKDLTLPQAAFLVGLPQSPYAYTPYTNIGTIKQDLDAGIARMKIVLTAMHRNGYINDAELEEAQNYDITKDFLQPQNSTVALHSYLYQAVHREAVIALMKQQIKQDGKDWSTVDASVELYNQYYFKAANLLASSGYKVYSTIDKKVYEAMQSGTADNIYLLGESYQTTYTDSTTGEIKTATEPPQIGSVAIENATGKILGFVGGRDFSVSQTDHAFSTRRSPGSTIKPLLVYGPAIDQNFIYPATILGDTAISRRQQDGSYWTPTNADNRVSNTFVSARYALKMSLNNPTVHLYSAMLQKGIDTGSYMKNMGISAIDSSEYLNEAASLGGFSTGPSVVEQTSAYTTFANDGKHITPYLIERIEDNQGNIVYQHEKKETQVFNAGTAYILRSMLNDSVEGGTTSYFKRYVNFTFPQRYGKTGTSDNYQDMWVIVSTPQITIGQWSGFDNNHGVNHVFAITNSDGPIYIRTQQLWANIANAIHSAAPEYFDTTKQFSTQPNNVMTSSVLSATGTLPGEITLNNGSKLNITGPMTSDLFLTSRPPYAISYQFAPGESSDTLNAYWSNLIQSLLPPETSSQSGQSQQTSEQRQNNQAPTEPRSSSSR